jgi:hypothetical protein
MRPTSRDIGPFERWLARSARGSQLPAARSDNTSTPAQFGRDDPLDWLTGRLRWEFILDQLRATVPTDAGRPPPATTTQTADPDHLTVDSTTITAA